MLRGQWLVLDNSLDFTNTVMQSLKAYEMNLNNAKPPYLINVKPLAHIVVYIP